MRFIALSLALAVFLGACGTDAAEPTTVSGEGSSSTAAESDFGVAADPADAERTVEVATLDELAFEPSSISVDAGETVTFVVSNEGRALHEFVIGDRGYQEEHEQAMEHGGHGTDLGNVVEVEPGDTGELTWAFPEGGEVLFACHVEGHYEGGMVGNFEIGE